MSSSVQCIYPKEEGEVTSLPVAPGSQRSRGPEDAGSFREESFYLKPVQRTKKDLYLYINSPGGSVTCGLAVFDSMHFVDPGVTTIFVGIAASGMQGHA